MLNIIGFCIVVFATIWASMAFEVQIKFELRQGGALINKIKEKHNTNVLVRNPPRILSSELRENITETSTWALPDPINARHLLGIDEGGKYDGFIGTFMEHLFKQGIDRFKNTALYLKRFIENRGKSFVPDLKSATDNYVLKLKLYYRHILTLNNKTNEEMILIDMIESTTKLYYSMQSKVLDAFAAKSNATLTVDLIEYVADTMYNDMIDTKKRGFQYICDHKSICKVYPGFSDYLADMILEILKLPDDKLVTVREIVANQVLQRKAAIAEIVFEKDFLQLLKLNEDLAMKAVGTTRRMLKNIHATITTRHKLIDTKDAKKLKIMKAERMFLDMIDKVFETDGEDEVTITFGTTERGLRQWMLGVRKNVDHLVRHFVNYVIEMCRFDWNLKTEEQIKVLIEVIMNGETKNEKLLDNLFTNGSSYLKSRVGGLFNLPMGL